MLTLTRIASDIQGAEGPVFDVAGRFLCVEPPTGSVLHIDEQGDRHTVANTGGIPAGLMVDADNRVWVADMKRGILRVEQDGRVVPVVDTYDQKPIRGCNDLVFDSRGNLYFTAPAGSSVKQAVGEVFWRNRDGMVERFDSGYAFCNGIAVTPDDSAVVIAETHTKRLHRFDLDAKGRPTGPRQLLATLEGQHDGGPDGIDYDTHGNLLATNWGGGCIEVFDPSGQRIERISLPFDHPSNLHFGGPDGCDLWITEHTHHAIWRGRWHHPGLLAGRFN